jgi:hypothetical protein
VVAFALLVVLTARAARPVLAVKFEWGRVLSPVGAGLAAFAGGICLVPAELGVVGRVPAGTIAIKLALGCAWLAWMWFGWMTGEERAGARAVLVRRRDVPPRVGP